MLLGSNLVIKVISQDATFHPVVNQPAVPPNLIHGTFVTPSHVVVIDDLTSVEVGDFLCGLGPCLGVVNVSKDVVVGIYGLANVTNDENYLIAMVLPACLT